MLLRYFILVYWMWKHIPIGWLHILSNISKYQHLNLNLKEMAANLHSPALTWMAPFKSSVTRQFLRCSFFWNIFILYGLHICHCHLRVVFVKDSYPLEKKRSKHILTQLHSAQANLIKLISTELSSARAI